MFSQVLIAALDEAGEIAITSTASFAPDGVQADAETDPDVVLMDYRPGCTGRRRGCSESTSYLSETPASIPDDRYHPGEPSKTSPGWIAPIVSAIRR
jgi:hypothetical protein